MVRVGASLFLIDIVRGIIYFGNVLSIYYFCHGRLWKMSLSFDEVWNDHNQVIFTKLSLVSNCIFEVGRRRFFSSKSTPINYYLVHFMTVPMCYKKIGIFLL